MSSLNMVWRMTRVHYWRLDRQVRSANRLLVITLLALLPMTAQQAYRVLLQDRLALVDPGNLPAALAPYLPFGFFVFLLFAILGADDMIRQLYINADTELLLVAPIPRRVIFVTKFAQCTRASLLPTLLYGVAFLIVGRILRASPAYYLQVASLIVFALVVVTAVTMSLVLLLVRFLPPRRVRAWTPLAVTAVMLMLALMQRPASDWLLAREAVITRTLDALLHATRPALIIAPAAGLALLAFLMAQQVFTQAFYEGWNRYVEVPATSGRATAAARRRLRFGGLSRAIPAPWRHVMVKEWLEMRRDSSTLFALALPIVYAVMLVGPMVGARSLGASLSPLIFWYLLFFNAFIFTTLPIGLPVLSILREGRNMALLRCSPISMTIVLVGKYWGAWLMTVSPWLIMLPIIAAWQQFPLWQTAALVGTAVWGLSGASAVSMALAALTADFRIEEPKRRISRIVSYLTMGINSLFVLLVELTAVWLILRSYPHSQVVRVITTISDWPLRWALSGTLLVPLSLLVMQVLFWCAIRTLWQAGTRRLERWEGV